MNLRFWGWVALVSAASGASLAALTQAWLPSLPPAAAVSAAAWEPGAVWQLYQEDWAFSLPPEYAGKVAGVDYNFTASDQPLRHSDVLIDGLYDGLRDGWTSTADQIAARSTRDFGFQEHPDPALREVQPWKISGERAEKVLNHGAARGVVLKDGTILRQARGEIAPRQAELLALFANGACLDWTGILFEPGGRIEFERDSGLGFAVLDESCYPQIP